MSCGRYITRETVLADDVATPINPGSNGEVGAREINRDENAPAQQKAMRATVGSAHIPSDNIARRIDVDGDGAGGAGNIKPSEFGVCGEITGNQDDCENHPYE